MSRLKNFHNRPQKTKGFSAGKGTKGAFGRGFKGFRDILTTGAIFQEAALANALKKALTGEGLEGFEVFEGLVLLFARQLSIGALTGTLGSCRVGELGAWLR